MATTAALGSQRRHEPPRHARYAATSATPTITAVANGQKTATPAAGEAHTAAHHSSLRSIPGVRNSGSR